MNKQKILSSFRSSRKGNEELVIVEGIHAFKHAVRFGAEIREVYTVDKEQVCGLMEKVARPNEVEAIRCLAKNIDVDFFSKLAPHALRTGLVALARRNGECTIQALDTSKPVIFLENPHDAENVGAVVRVAAGYGASAVVVHGAMYPWNANCIRASAGLHFALPVCHRIGLDALSKHRSTFACATEGDNMYTAKLPKNAVLIFGTERYGITDEVKRKADACITIPMQKDVSSLNLATSVSAVLYGALR